MARHHTGRLGQKCKNAIKVMQILESKVFLNNPHPGFRAGFASLFFHLAAPTCAVLSFMIDDSERVQQRWIPVLRQDARQDKDLEQDGDSKKSHLALE
jgi:hypothetical protein